MSDRTNDRMTDRALRAPADLEGLRFDDRGLLPVLAQDATSGRLLMVAWANREALTRSLATHELHFFSRSRRAIWRKGETSGHVLRLRSLHADCDRDTVLALVEPAGPACHTGEMSCFGEGAAAGATTASEAGAAPASATGAPATTPASSAGGAPSATGALDRLWSVIEERARTRPEGSYTTRLLGDENLRLKKLGEETVELVTALARADGERIPEEAADLLYHLLTALRGAGVELRAVLEALEARRR